MRKLHLLFFLLLFFGVSNAQEKLSKEEQARREKNIQAGNPFAKYGYKAKVATLSKGKYLEFHDLDSIVTIGTMRWHVDKNQIVEQIAIDTLNIDHQPIGDRAGRWMSPDPLSEEFPDYSPYTFCFNNPMRFVDPDGMAPDDIVILGANNSSVTLKTNLIDIKVNASSLGVDFGGNYSLSGNDVLSAGLDIVGVFDPTGVADVLGASLAAEQGDWTSALISSVGVVPYLGDVAKVGKIGKDVKIIENAIDGIKAVNGNSKASEKAQHVYEIVNNTTKGVEKVGVSGGKISKAGDSYRATSQVNKLNKAGGNYSSRIAEKIPAGKGARADALKREQQITNANKSSLNERIHKKPKPE